MALLKGSKVLKEKSFPSKTLKDRKSFKKTYKIQNNETLKIDKGVIVTRIQHDIRKHKPEPA
ncbi:hypothetical protein [Halomonas sp. M4R1S46]|uniref:hypothetical protein n=1 Tax=Halomonas sp. M4R1S46 TaxID=2982692 RepID=UPI0021E3D95C|nr:hypothetical protein [Halomonas sp. M4R1S46]UYG07282.1 hypothetical protein OCT48_16865 [Halomonas sp. M4R1S46]